MFFRTASSKNEAVEASDMELARLVDRHKPYESVEKTQIEVFTEVAKELTKKNWERAEVEKLPRSHAEAY